MELKGEYQKKLIAHGCGLYKGLIYTNSLEAFIKNYNIGYRRFEIDFHLTKKDTLISYHNSLGYNFIKEEEYNSISLKYLLTGIADIPLITNSNFFIPQEETVNKAYQKQQLTPINVEELAYLCKKYQDVEFILDTKYTSYKLYMKQFKLIRNAFEKLELELKQLTPQFYNIDMAQNVNIFSNFCFYSLQCTIN